MIILKPDMKKTMIEKISCQREELRIYKKEDLPTRQHFSNNRRIEDLILDMSPGYTAQINNNWTINGTHGYDNYYSLMNVS